MLKFLSRTLAPEPVRVPDGRRVYAIGDVHGCASQFDRLLELIREDEAMRPPALTQLVLLGDLIDRGPGSRAVVERAMRLADEPGFFCLKGNHEELLLRASEGDRQALQLFDRVGGRETMLSYGVDAATYDDATLDDLAALIRSAVPADHLAFLAEGGDHLVVGDYVFVHAGLRPGLPLAEQRDTDLRWIREPFLNHRGRFEQFVVHGHTIVDAPDVRSNRIGIDTGAYAGGPLTAIGLEGEERWFLSA